MTAAPPAAAGPGAASAVPFAAAIAPDAHQPAAPPAAAPPAVSPAVAFPPPPAFSAVPGEPDPAESPRSLSDAAPFAAADAGPAIARDGAAAPAATPAPLPPGAAAEAAARVGAAIAAARDGDRVELRLDPPELGRVSIDIRIEDGRLSAVLGAERPETLDLMRRHAEALQRELSAAGFDRAQLSFGDRDPAPRRDAEPAPRAYGEAAPAYADADPEDVARLARRGGAGGLDIRL